MKKRRTLIIALLLVAALALGIGYAGFTSELSIGGEAIQNGISESQVVITKIVRESASADYITVTAECGESGVKNASVDVTGFKEPNEEAVLTVTVSNPHPFEVNMSAPALTITESTNDAGNGAKYFDIQIMNPSAIPASIGADEEVTFQIKIVALTIAPDAHTTNFTVGFSASTRT